MPARISFSSWGQSAIDAALLDCRQTMSESILVSWWAGFATYAAMPWSVAHDQAFFLLIAFD
jgi:hypothetical protein